LPFLDRGPDGGPVLKPLSLSIRPEPLAVCRLGPDVALRESLSDVTFWSVTRTEEELSVVLPESEVPSDWDAEPGWRCIGVRGPLAFGEIGILASLATPLAEARISVFAISTHDTDYILVRDTDLPEALRVLTEAGHTVDL
jgi:hypothetical protein